MMAYNTSNYVFSHVSHGFKLRGEPSNTSILPFELLAGTDFLGNLDYIDENKLSRVDFANSGRDIRIFFKDHDAGVQVFPREILHRFEPGALRIQMLFRRTQAWRHRLEHENCNISCMNLGMAEFREIVKMKHEARPYEEEVRLAK